MKQKEVEDVFGGKEEFANADSVASKCSQVSCLTWFEANTWFLFSTTAQCPAEHCNGDRAYFFQLQIRSADEPMTTFLKVGGFASARGQLAYSSHTDYEIDSVLPAVPGGEKTDSLSWFIERVSYLLL
jgi:hypothetical protein